MTDLEMIEKIPPTEVEITGPYHYPHDLHPCLRLEAKGHLYSQDRILASLYIIDGDEARAWAEAYMIKEAFRLGGKEIDRIHYASGVDTLQRTS